MLEKLTVAQGHGRSLNKTSNTVAHPGDLLDGGLACLNATGEVLECGFDGVPSDGHLLIIQIEIRKLQPLQE